MKVFSSHVVRWEKLLLSSRCGAEISRVRRYVHVASCVRIGGGTRMTYKASYDAAWVINAFRKAFRNNPFTTTINATLVLAFGCAVVGVYLLLTNDHYYFRYSNSPGGP